MFLAGSERERSKGGGVKHEVDHCRIDQALMVQQEGQHPQSEDRGTDREKTRITYM